ncbi:MAG: hypothetical protein IT370_28170 [Deltaproteobacteria bacterium]|nr:hypothetical protein [Deltaproteobacteria bacterium]
MPLSFAEVATADAEALLAAAPELIARPPGFEDWRVLARALAALDDARAFRLLREHRGKPHMGAALERCKWAGGCAEILTACQDWGAVGQHELRNCLWYLARHRWQPAWPLLSTVYLEHGDSNVVNDAGWALREWGDARSLAVVEGALGAADHTRQRHALQLLLARAPGEVVDRMGGLATLAQQGARAGLLLHLVGSADGDAARQAETPPRLWAVEPRFVELAQLLVRDRQHKQTAKWVLDLAGVQVRPLAVAEAEAGAKAKAGAGATGAPGARARRGKALPDGAALLARYEEGAHAEVTTALCKLGPRVREPEVLEGARAVARALMRRVRGNLELVIGRLEAGGYVFERRAQALGRGASAAELAALEAAVGQLPVLLHAALEVLGEVDLRGRAPRMQAEWQTDPLMLASASALLEDAADHDGSIAFDLAIAPDALGKAGFSAGAHVIEVPAAGFDAAVTPRPGRQAGLLGLLRESLAAAGFPGLARQKGASRFTRAWMGPLRAGLRPF